VAKPVPQAQAVMKITVIVSRVVRRRPRRFLVESLSAISIDRNLTGQPESPVTSAGYQQYL
jgi:hypothetical protein